MQKKDITNFFNIVCFSFFVFVLNECGVFHLDPVMNFFFSDEMLDALPFFYSFFAFLLGFALILNFCLNLVDKLLSKLFSFALSVFGGFCGYLVYSIVKDVLLIKSLDQLIVPVFLFLITFGLAYSLFSMKVILTEFIKERDKVFYQSKYLSRYKIGGYGFLVVGVYGFSTIVT